MRQQEILANLTKNLQDREIKSSLLSRYCNGVLSELSHFEKPQQFARTHHNAM